MPVVRSLNRIPCGYDTTSHHMILFHAISAGESLSLKSAPLFPLLQALHERFIRLTRWSLAS
jgi:hypothetical protein